MRSANVYRALLWCYPAQFRHEYGREMTRAFTSQLRDAHAQSGRAVAAVWAGALVDLAPTAIREHIHVMRQDLRHAIRILAATPGFTAVAVLSLALGIGANTAIFSLLDSVLFKALPVRNPHELVMLTDPEASGTSVGSEGGDRSLMTYPEFLELQAGTTRSFAALLASDSSLKEIQARIGGGDLEPLTLRMVSASYFSALGVPTVFGHSFDSAQEPPPRTAPVAVISYEFWKKRFGVIPKSSAGRSRFDPACCRSSASRPSGSSARPSANGLTRGFRWRCRRRCCRAAIGFATNPAASRK